MSKLSQKDLRRLMLEKKSKLDTTKHSSAKVNSPLAKYDSFGNLSCIICKAAVKSSAVWKVHVNSKQHKFKLEAAKQLKSKLLSNYGDFLRPESDVAISTIKETKTESLNVPNVSADAKNQEKISSNLVLGSEDILPEKFFDDPVKDAKIRNADYKDSQDDEWERFQREIKEESSMSNAIIAGEQDEAAVLREIEEIDEQMNRWSKFMNLEEKKKLMLTKNKENNISNNTINFDETQSSEESDSFDEFSDWRSKMFQK